jgi:hypothetical protein
MARLKCGAVLRQTYFNREIRGQKSAEDMFTFDVHDAGQNFLVSNDGWAGLRDGEKRFPGKFARFRIYRRAIPGLIRILSKAYRT